MGEDVEEMVGRDVMALFLGAPQRHHGGEAGEDIEFRVAGDGTDVVLTHERLHGDAVFAFHTMGWTDCFDRLEALFDEGEAT